MADNSWLTDGGETKIINALAATTPFNITKWKVGDTANVPFNAALTDVVGNVVDSGTVAEMEFDIISANSILIRVILSESKGPYDVGNIGLFSDDDTLIAIGTFEFAKQKTPNAIGVVGNRLVNNINIKFVDVQNAINFSILSGTFASWPFVQTIADLPDPNLAPFEGYIVREDPSQNRPITAIRNEEPSGSGTFVWTLDYHNRIAGDSASDTNVYEISISDGAHVAQIGNVDRYRINNGGVIQWFDNLGNEKMRMDNAGQFGIGRTSMSQVLHLEDSSDPTIRWSRTGSTTYGELAMDSTGTMFLRADHNNVANNSSIIFQVDGNQRAMIDNNGFFGVGLNLDPTVRFEMQQGDSGGALEDAFILRDSGFVNVLMRSGGADGVIQVGEAGQLRGEWASTSFGTITPHNMEFKANSVTALTLTSAGTVQVATPAGGGTRSLEVGLQDNTGNAVQIAQGTNNYLTIDTLDGSETLTFGNSGTFPNHVFNGAIGVNTTPTAGTDLHIQKAGGAGDAIIRLQMGANNHDIYADDSDSDRLKINAIDRMTIQNNNVDRVEIDPTFFKILTGPLILEAGGGVTSPVISINNDTDTGFYQPGADSWGLTLGGVSRYSQDGGTATFTCFDFLIGHEGRRGTPGRALVDNTGILDINFANDWATTRIGGATVQFTGTVLLSQISLDNGSAASPALRFNSDLDCGIYYNGSGLSISDDSVEIARFVNGQINLLPSTTVVSGRLQIDTDGSSGSPSIEWGTTGEGFFRDASGSGSIRMITGGLQPVEFSNTGIHTTIGLKVGPNSASQIRDISNIDRMYAGRVNSGGGAVSLPTGWSSVRTGGGQYTVTHNRGDSNYTVSLTATGFSSGIILNSRGNNSFSVITKDSSNNVAIDVDFDFIVMFND